MQTPQKISAARRLMTALAGLTLAGVLMLAATAPPAQAQEPAIGVVDGVKINDNYNKLKASLEALEKQKQSLRAQLDARVFMTEADTKRFDELIVKTTRNEAENAELDKLVKGGTERGTEYNGLIPKVTRTDADNARIKALEEEMQRTSTTFRDVINKVDEAVSKQEIATENQYRDQIVKVVEQVATEKKLVLVVGKQAIAWNAKTIEITDEVLTRLNKA
jgi:Skp family chaperone for outer membrane proteins